MSRASAIALLRDYFLGGAPMMRMAAALGSSADSLNPEALSFRVTHPISALLQAPMTVFRRFTAPISFARFFSISGIEFFSVPKEGNRYANRHSEIFRQRQGLWLHHQ